MPKREPSLAKLGTGIVFEVASYYGRATTDIWEWDGPAVLPPRTA